MSIAKFAISFSIAIASVAVAMWAFGQSADTAPYTDIGWYAAVIFSVLSVAVYMLTNVIADTEKKSLFLQLIMMNMLFKLVLSVLIVFIYYKHMQPSDGIFVVPFIVVYVIFTVFETYFMNEQAKAK